ncbi:DUF2252 domain-containing protein [Geodermatophilus marinus]|uniref:DUF2252 domain-containing protein n=1 Tax=Geodermatophilus sp. LHW52908 TaxID=2303986 RepID=UPI001F39CA81|nr:DUF2252 family protein [Geodermatophilus sp. LHW52908]
MADTTLDDRTRAELAALAREADLPGRSSMNRAQLIEALRDRGNGGGADPNGDGAGALGDGPEPPEDAARTTGERGGRSPVSRVAAFETLARARAEGQMVLVPRQLHGNDRRMHVRETVREDHRFRIDRNAEGTQEKFDVLADSQYAFFRGTALLFYRDMAGEDARMPTVLALGDVHPGNFGVMPSADNVPIFGVNDFDEASYAPFTWDLKRGSTGFLLGAEVLGGRGPGKAEEVVRCFVRGYLDGMATFARRGDETDTQVRRDNAPPLIADLIAGAVARPRAGWLADKHLNPTRTGFKVSRKCVPVTSRVEEFQEIVDRYVAENGIDVPARANGMQVKDVARRLGKGTASLGLTRYHVLLGGPAGDGTDDLVLEFKQARRSALAGLVPPSNFRLDGYGGRIRDAQRVQLVGGDVFFGAASVDGQSFMVRERAPYRDDLDLEDISGSEWREYAGICGRVLAHTHSLSDDAGEVDYDVEPAVLEAAGEPELFVDDMLRFAGEAVDRLRADHAAFRADHALGAFQHLELVYD